MQQLIYHKVMLPQLRVVCLTQLTHRSRRLCNFNANRTNTSLHYNKHRHCVRVRIERHRPNTVLGMLTLSTACERLTGDKLRHLATVKFACVEAGRGPLKHASQQAAWTMDLTVAGSCCLTNLTPSE